MSIELKIPDVGESIREIQIGRWLKQEGEVVAQDEDLVELETDKASMELPAPAAGVLAKILKKQGDTVGVGDVIGYLEKDGAATEDKVPASAGEAEPEATVKKKVQAATAPPAEEKKGERKKSDAKDTKEPRDKTGGTPTIATSEKQEQEPATPAEKVPVTPAARRALRDHGLSAAEIEAKGPRIHRKDVLRYVEEHRDKKPAGDKSELEVVEEAPKKDVEQAAGELEEVVPMSLIRRHIAERLVQAQQQAALLTTFNEIDMSGVKELRAAYRDRFQEKYGVKLGFMSFFVKAVVDALKGQPELNAEIRDRNIVYRHYHHIGIAIGSAKGLVVPVLRFAERLSFAEIEQAIDDFSRRAAENELEPQELEGGTFTITNGGVYGSLLSTPIVNPPQSGILGMHAIQDRPVAREGQVVIRPMMYVALTYDHRLVDGRQAVTFLTRIKEAIEDPSRMLLEV